MRFLILSLLASLLLPPAVAAAGAEYQLAGPASSRKKSSSKKKKARRYINLSALHQSLPGSQMPDETSLLFRVDNCDVVVLADDEQRVKFIFLRVIPGVKKAKRREALNAVKSRLQLAYDKPSTPNELIAADGSAALLYFDLPVAHADAALIAATRCDVLQNILGGFSDPEPELRPAEGLACAFVVETEGVEMEISVDLSLPLVNYVELRGGKVKSKVKPDSVIKGLFSGLDSKPERAYASFGKGDDRLRTLSCDGTFYMARNAGFFVIGTVNHLKQAAQNGIGTKKYGFSKPDFTDWEVTLPTGPAADSLLEATADEPVPAEPEAPTPADTPEVKPPVAEPEPTTPTPAGDTPADQPAQADGVLTPEAAREAYRKMLREM